jgi:hypothetical protein
MQLLSKHREFALLIGLGSKCACNRSGFVCPRPFLRTETFSSLIKTRFPFDSPRDTGEDFAAAILICALHPLLPGDKSQSSSRCLHLSATSIAGNGSRFYFSTPSDVMKSQDCSLLIGIPKIFSVALSSTIARIASDCFSHSPNLPLISFSHFSTPTQIETGVLIGLMHLDRCSISCRALAFVAIPGTMRMMGEFDPPERENLGETWRDGEKDQRWRRSATEESGGEKDRERKRVAVEEKDESGREQRWKKAASAVAVEESRSSSSSSSSSSVGGGGGGEREQQQRRQWKSVAVEESDSARERQWNRAAVQESGGG